MTTYTYTGNQYTNIPATTGTTFGPLDLVGGNTSTAANNITNDASRVTIMAIVVRSYSASMTFDLNKVASDGTPTVVANFTPTSTGSIDFGPYGIEFNSGWSITQGATAGTLSVVWTRIV